MSKVDAAIKQLFPINTEDKNLNIANANKILGFREFKAQLQADLLGLLPEKCTPDPIDDIHAGASIDDVYQLGVDHGGNSMIDQITEAFNNYFGRK